MSETNEVETPADHAVPAPSDAAPSEPPPSSPAEEDDEPSVASDTKKKDEPEDTLLAKGNPLRWKRGLGAILVGAVPLFLLMAKNGQNAWGIPVGFLFVLVIAFGVMDLLGSFDDQPVAPDADPTDATTPGAGEVVSHVTLGDLRGPILGSAGVTILFGVVLSLAQGGTLPGMVASVLVPATFLGAVAMLFRTGVALGAFTKDELGLDRPLLSRHGFWVIAVGALLYFPLLGSFSLWDPWETHYGEVAREIVSRDDWISLWWAQDGWFWSKPILNFWIQSLAMGSLGTHVQPDQMLIGASGIANAHPEWVVRTPNVLMTIAAMYLLYKGVAKVFGRRAGLLGGIVLATMPDWYFLAHQTMTDMPFVAAMTAAMGLLLFGLNSDEDERVRLYEVEAFGTKLRFSLWHLVWGVVLVCAIPQIFYLLSRNVELVLFGDGPKGFRVHWDELKSGSAGNCGIPGNEACTPHVPASLPKGDTWWNHGSLGFLRFFGAFEPAAQGIAWGVVLGAALYLNWGERRTRRIVYVSAWLAAAIATMAKGPAGFGLPIICAIAYVGTKRRWKELLNFELVTGLLIILAVALPWYVAMYVRHGSPFTDRLIFHDMFNRAFSHVHDTNEGDDTGIRYYVWQLGYATFPWVGLVPLGLLWGFRRSDSAFARVLGRSQGATATSSSAAVGDASVMLLMWFLFGFALFTFMGTKFHHYIFPAVPPAAMLVGIVLDDMLGKANLPRAGRLAAYGGGLVVATGLAVWGAMHFWPGGVLGAKPEAGTGGSPAIAIVALVVSAALFVALAKLFPIATHDDADAIAEIRRDEHEQLMLGAASLAGVFAIVLVGRDLSLRAEAGEMTGAIRLLQLFTYNYKRPWPDSLDFSAVLGGFTVVAALLGVVASWRGLRRHAVVALTAFGLLWAVWGLEVYMVELSPHWGQHEVIEAYYRDRKGPEEPLVAYQMNWKGENFYTSNRIPAFVSTGQTFQTYLKKEREKGTKVLYLVTEHSRIGGLRSEVAGKAYKEMTDKALNNKFILIRADL